MSFLKKIQSFSRSPQGRRLTDKAMRAAKDPKTQAKVRGLSGRFGGGAKRPPH